MQKAFIVAVSNAPKITEWISAISTATLGLLGLVFTSWQWRSNGFRPRLSARIDTQGEAIELKIVNNGRAAGVIEEVLVLRPAGRQLVVDKQAEFEGFTERQFKSILLPGLSSMRLLIEAPKDRPFPKDARLKVSVGKTKDRDVPLNLEDELSLFGLKSVLPPGTKT